MQVGTVLVRNQMKGMTVLSTDPSGKDEVRWDALGDLHGGDVQIVTEHMAHSPNFMRAVSRGILKIEDNTDPELLAALDQQGAYWRDQQDKVEEEALASIDTESQDAILPVKCIGPDCQADLTMRQSAMEKNPPLCDGHQHLAPQFVPTEGDRVNGRLQTVWTRIPMGARQRGEK
jgi:hypothetical protein